MDFSDFFNSEIWNTKNTTCCFAFLFLTKCQHYFLITKFIIHNHRKNIKYVINYNSTKLSNINILVQLLIFWLISLYFFFIHLYPPADHFPKLEHHESHFMDSKLWALQLVYIGQLLCAPRTSSKCYSRGMNSSKHTKEKQLTLSSQKFINVA